MILNDTPTNEAVLSNVGAVSAFTIKATAKSFKILSDGLYANKIRAIIREISCNAHDSHIAAGQTLPFIVHLPNSMEPYFSVRDFGVGLSHDQVVDIFTSFFTSTKTESNDFIGALGLGSKSPFSYTDNFTVTTVKDGVRGIYTAFINDTGVPSIALMMSESTDQPNGVEVRFAVVDRYDFRRFTDEATNVFKFWKNRPTITGVIDFQFEDPQIVDRDIVPGVHTLGNSYYHQAYAVMGNIAYPITVPSADTIINAGYRSMLNCGLVLEFNIGELDFQASREGLSYVPLTLNSIKSKLDATATHLAIRIAEEADKIENLWERAAYLQKRLNEDLWKSATLKYIADSKFPLMDATKTAHWNMLHRFRFSEDTLKSEFNMVIRGFVKNRGQTSCSAIKPSRVNKSATPNTTVIGYEWEILPEMDKYFVFNDTKVGAVERVKNHWRQNVQDNYTEAVYVIEPADKKQPIKQAEFLAAIMNPPESRVILASSLNEKERVAGLGRNVSILRLETHRIAYGREATVWKDAGKADQYGDTTAYYYLPLSGYKSLGKVEDVKWLKTTLKNSGIFTDSIFGVRKSDKEWVESQVNWINLDTFIETKLAALNDTDVMGMVKEAIGFNHIFNWNVEGQIAKDSPYAALMSVFKDIAPVDSARRSALKTLCDRYKVVTATTDPQALIEQYSTEINKIKSRYPLLSCISKYSANNADIADYINLIDKSLATVAENT